MTTKKCRVCVCTSYRADTEPRAPRHAAAIANLGRDFEVIFVDCAPADQPSQQLAMLEGKANLMWLTHFYQHRHGTIWKLIYHRFLQMIGQWTFRMFGILWAGALSRNVIGLDRILYKADADIYIAHNIDSLLPAARVAERLGSKLMFDCMEFYSDMGDSQTKLDQCMIRAIETKVLPKCALVLASSDQVADEYAKVYHIPRPTQLYNMPPLEAHMQSIKDDQFRLYWRNSVIGLGQRGLEEALIGLRSLPDDVTLHIQGKMPVDGGAALRARIDELCLTERVIIHPPFMPGEAVREASKYTVGLCLERAVNKNHDLTVSNKIFDYMMAGLAVVASDLPGLRSVIERSGGGLLFKAGSAGDLAKIILKLYNERELLRQLKSNARKFAVRDGNLDIEMKRFVDAFLAICNEIPSTLPNISQNQL